MTTYDTIVIGSGMGGMVAALLLAQKGQKVAMLEAGLQFGGYMNPFKRKKFHFDVGLHYIGECGPGQHYSRLFERLGLADKIQFRELSPDGFDRYVFPGYETALCKGHEAYRERLVADFPEEKEGLHTFFEQLESLDRLLRTINKPMGLGSIGKLVKDAPMLRHLRSTFSEVVSPIISSPLLRNVLAGPCGDVGLPPSKVSGMYMMGLLNHYLGGGYYPVGGSGSIVRAILDSLKEHGAELRRRTTVKEILLRQGKAAGVRLDTGEELHARHVVSNVDAAITYGDLLPPSAVPWRLRRKTKGMTPSLANMAAYIATDLDVPAHGLNDANIWNYEDQDLDAIYAPLLEGRFGEKLGFFVTVTTLKDPEGERAPAGNHTIEVIVLAPYAPFKQWEGTRTLKREQEYYAFKEGVVSPVIDIVEKKYLPGLRDHLLHYELSSPLTNVSYTRAPLGSIYGPEQSPAMIGPFRYGIKTPIPNLFLCGASTLGAGVVPCAMSGKVAAYGVLEAASKQQFASA